MLFGSSFTRFLTESYAHEVLEYQLSTASLCYTCLGTRMKQQEAQVASTGILVFKVIADDHCGFTTKGRWCKEKTLK